MKERRRELHRAVGHAIEELYPDRLADHTEELAHHFTAAEDWRTAFEYQARSGDRAKYAYANQAALDFYARALEAAGRARPPVEPARLMLVHQNRSAVLTAMSRFLEAVEEAQKMLALARAEGDRRSEAQALVDTAFAYFMSFRSEHADEVRRCAESARVIAAEIGDDRLLARSLACIGSMDQSDGNLDDADRKFAESLRLSEAGGFKDAVAHSQMYLGAHANWQGRFRDGVRISRGAEEVAAEIHDPIELLGLAFRCLSEIGLGDYHQARATITGGLARARDWRNAFIEGRLLNSLGWLHQELGDFRQALELDRQSAEIGERMKNPNVEISALINCAWDHYHLGDPPRALALLEDLAVRVDKFAFGAHRWRWSIHIATYAAELLLLGGETAAAVGRVDRALAQARSTGSLKYVARCHALHGRIALAEGNAEHAARELREALRLAREIEYPTLTWQAAHHLARAQAAAGRADEARAAAAVTLETIESVAARAPESGLAHTFLAWPLVEQAREDAERLRRA